LHWNSTAKRELHPVSRFSKLGFVEQTNDPIRTLSLVEELPKTVERYTYVTGCSPNFAK